jgi:hypothetical protein
MPKAVMAEKIGHSFQQIAAMSSESDRVFSMLIEGASRACPSIAPRYDDAGNFSNSNCTTFYKDHPPTLYVSDAAHYVTCCNLY